jgi:hypothetical protein
MLQAGGAVLDLTGDEDMGNRKQAGQIRYVSTYNYQAIAGGSADIIEQFWENI